MMSLVYVLSQPCSLELSEFLFSGLSWTRSIIHLMASPGSGGSCSLSGVHVSVCPPSARPWVLSTNLPEDTKVILEQEGKEVNSKAPYWEQVFFWKQRDSRVGPCTGPRGLAARSQQ